MFVTGEAGVGKTALIEAFIHAVGDRARVLRGVCEALFSPRPLGPFYELESSSPAAALAPGQSLTHVHRTLHLSGAEKDLDVVARAAFGVSLAEMKAALKP